MKFNKFYKLIFFGLSSFSILTPVVLSSCRNNVVDSSNDDNKDDNTQQEIKKVKPPIQPANYDDDNLSYFDIRSSPYKQNITFKIDPTQFDNELNKYCSDWWKKDADFSEFSTWHHLEYYAKNLKLPNKDVFYNLLRVNENNYSFWYKDIVNGAEETITINNIDYFNWSCLFNDSCEVTMNFSGPDRKEFDEYLKNYFDVIDITISLKKGYEWDILREDTNGTFNNSKFFSFRIQFDWPTNPKPQQ